MAKLSTAELLDAFKELTLIELSEFVKEFETTFGVTAAAPVAAAAAPAAGGGDAAVEEEEAATRSTSSSRRPARRRSRSSRRCARSPASASRRPRIWSRPRPRPSWRRSPRRPPTRPRRPSRPPAPPSPTSDLTPGPAGDVQRTKTGPVPPPEPGLGASGASLRLQTGAGVRGRVGRVGASSSDRCRRTWSRRSAPTCPGAGLPPAPGQRSAVIGRAPAHGREDFAWLLVRSPLKVCSSPSRTGFVWFDLACSRTLTRAVEAA